MVLISPESVLDRTRVSYSIKFTIIGHPGSPYYPLPETETLQHAPSSCIDCYLGYRVLRVLVVLVVLTPNTLEYSDSRMKASGGRWPADVQRRSAEPTVVVRGVCPPAGLTGGSQVVGGAAAADARGVRRSTPER